MRINLTGSGFMHVLCLRQADGTSIAVPELAIQRGLPNEGSKPLWNIPLVAKAAVGSAKNIAWEF